jgi:uncharacterized protein YfaS (alpha-2-macroglobulin family)
VIEITFPSPVAKPAEFNQESGPGFLETTPKLAGKVVWKSERVARYELSEAPLAGTEYTFALGSTEEVIRRRGQPGVVAGKVATGPFKMERCESPGYWYGGEIEAANIRLVCWFSDEVNPESVKPNAYFKDASGAVIPAEAAQASLDDARRSYKVPKSLRQRFSERPAATPVPSPTPSVTSEMAKLMPVANGLVFTPSRPLPAGKGWQFFLEPRFASSRGGGVLAEAFHRELGYISAPSVAKIECAPNPGGKRSVIVHFNSRLADAETDQKEAKKFVEVQPAVANLEVSIGWRCLTLTGDFEIGREYAVKVRAGIAGKNGLALQNDFQGKAKFRPSDPTLTLPSFDSAQFSLGRRLYEIHSVNMNNVRVRIKALSGTELVRALQSYDRYTGKHRGEEDLRHQGELPFELISGRGVYDHDYSYKKSALDEVNSLGLDWSKILGPMRPAALFISCEGQPREETVADRNEARNQQVTQALVQLTDLGAAWKQDADGVLLYAFSCQTGGPVADAVVQVFGDDAAPMATLSTDITGQVRLPVNKNSFTLKLTKGEDQYCLVFDENLPQIPRYRFPVRVGYRPQTQFRNTVSMFTDRFLYRPGETMHLKGIWRQRLDTQLRIPQEREVTINLKDEDDRVLTTRTAKLTDVGTFAETFELPADTVGHFRAEVELPKPKVKAGKEQGEEEEDDEDLAWRWRWRHGYFERGQRYVFSESFLVQEFRRNTFELHLAAPQAPRLGEESQVDLTANYLMGKPLSAGKVSWSVHTHPVGFYPERYSGFYFGDHASYDRFYWYRYFGFREEASEEDMEEGDQSQDGKTGELSLAEAGATRIVFPLPKYSFPSRIAVRVHAEVTDANQQTLGDGVSFQIPSSEFYLGMRRIDSLVHVGQEIALDFIAVNNLGEAHGKPVHATVTVEHELWNTTATRTGNGDTATHSESSRKEVFRKEITLKGDAPESIKYTPAQAGSHYVIIRSRDDSGAEVATRVKINAYGDTGYAWEYEDGARIRLVPDKREYLPGQTAKILVQTPVDGTALVTMERNKIQRSFVTQLNSRAPVLEVPVTDADSPNVYVSVTLIKGAGQNQREVKEPIAKLGYCELKVKNQADRLTVSLTPASAVVRPGSTTSIEGTVFGEAGEGSKKGWFARMFGANSKSAPVSNAEVTLWVVDEGVLQVAGYANPDWMAALMPLVPLGVFGGTTLPLFLPEDPKALDFSNKGFSAGGGGLSEAGKLRVDFNPCPLWIGSIRTDAKGNFRAEYKVPDSLTRFRVLAVAVAGERKFGSAASAVTVNKPLMIQPVVPRVAHVGDNLQVKAMLHNTSKVAGEFEITLKSGENCPIIGANGSATASLTKRVRLGVNESKAVPFDVNFQAMGDAQWDWTAKVVSTDSSASEGEKAGLVDAVQSKFPIHYPLPLFREEAYARIDQAGTPVDLLKDLSPELLKGDGLLTVEITPSILTEAGAAIDHVLHYPYGCVEQTTSSMAPWFAAKDLREYSSAMRKSDAEIADSIQHGANRLLSMQTSSGALAYWPGGTEPCLWGSAYGGMGLLLAKANGAEIPHEAIDKLTTYLANALRNGEASSSSPYSYYSSYWPETRARILYVLALAGKPEPSYMATMAKDASSYSASTRGLLAMAIMTGGGSKEGARKVLAAKSSVTGYESDLHFLGRSLDIPLELMGWAMVDPTASRTVQLLDSLIASRTREGHWGATINNAWSLNALAAYARAEKRSTQTLSAEVSGAVKEQFSFQPGQRGYKELRIPLKSKSNVAPQLTAVVSQGAPLFCRLRLVSRPQIAPAQEIDSGFSISRSYQKVNPKGGTEPIGTLQPGDVVLVNLFVHVPSRFEYLSVEDPLPAILEAVNPEFASQAAPNANDLIRTDWTTSHMEYRDDRVAFFCDSIQPGRFTLHYLARVTGQGSVFAPPARVEAMYSPEKYGLSATSRFENAPTAAPSSK